MPDITVKCPRCGARMRLRTRRKDKIRFWVCTKSPECRGISPYTRGATAEVTIEACQDGRLQCWSCPHWRKDSCFLTQAFCATLPEGTTGEVSNQGKVISKSLAVDDDVVDDVVDDKPIKCPQCDSSNVHRQEGKVQRVAAGWFICFDCWHKWDGVRADGLSLVAPGIVPRLTQ